MKKVIRPIFGSMLFLLSGFLMISCSNDSPSGQEQQSEEVIFEFDLNQIVETKATVEPIEEAACGGEELTATPYSFVIKTWHLESNTEHELKGTLGTFNGKLKSDPIHLPTGTHKLLDAKVHKGGPVLYQAVMPDSKFAAFVPAEYHLGSTFTVLPYTKPTVTNFMLCTIGHSSEEFGMPKFELQRVETYCFDLFVNVCDPKLNNEHFVGKGSVKVYSKEGGNLLWEDTDGFDEGKIGTVCFADYLDNPSKSYYIEISLNNNFLNPKPQIYAGTVPVSE
ncbi:MAG: hypothetical protein ACRCX5_06225, partial [Bacteroidales bacterium]